MVFIAGWERQHFKPETISERGGRREESAGADGKREVEGGAKEEAESFGQP